jgi:hypothetical protein
MQENYFKSKYGKTALIEGFITEGKKHSEDSTSRRATAHLR